MVQLLAIILITCQGLWANPFASALIGKANPKHSYFEQKPPFKYPFKRTADLNHFQVNLKQMSALLGPSDKLNQLEKIYQSFPYNRKLNLYAYDFTVGTEWDILPYPLIERETGEDPKSWNSHFKSEIHDEGVQTLSFLQKIDELTGTKAYAGNSLDLLKTPDSLHKIMEKLASSRNHVFMSSFLFQCDAGSTELLSLMEKKAKEGVRIFLIIDKTFTLTDKKCVKRLKKLGINFGLKGSLLKVFHEKMYVFDGEYALVDGQNIVAAQTLSNGSNNLINDMGIGMTGPMVQEVAHHFINYWQQISKDMPEDLIAFYRHQKEKAQAFQTEDVLKAGLTEKQGVCRFVAEAPGKKDRHIIPLYKAYVEAAKHYLFLNMIDLRFEKMGNKLGTEFLDMLVQKSNANPDFRIDMLSNQWKLPTDIALPKGQGVKGNWFSFLITKPGLLFFDLPHKQIGKGRKRIVPELMHNNLHWWAQAIYNHSKTLMVDNIATMVGSFNINNISNSSSFEQVVICHDQKLAEEMQESILHDLLNSIPIPLKAL